MDTKVKVGETLNLKSGVLPNSSVEVIWEYLKSSGWCTIPKVTGKDLKLNKVHVKYSGSYRCILDGVASRVAQVSVHNVTTLEEATTLVAESDSDIILSAIESLEE